jgi:seryl-tRNA synthetase
MADPNGSGRIDRIENALGSLITSVASLTDVTRMIAGQVNRLAEAQIETQDTVAELAEKMTELTGKVGELAEAQQNTEERLDALITTVDNIIRHISPPPQ